VRTASFARSYWDGPQSGPYNSRAQAGIERSLPRPCVRSVKAGTKEGKPEPSNSPDLAMPPRRAPRPLPRRDAPRPSKEPIFRRSSTRWGLALASLAVVAVVAFGAWSAWERDRPRRLREQAEAATLARDWRSALASWSRVNESGAATARTLLAEARAALALDRANDARLALERASKLDPAVAEVWQVRLDLLRVLDRPLEALNLGRTADPAVAPEARRGLLASVTLAALAELPDDEARTRLDRWIAADPNDLDARVSRLARIAANAHPGDPDRASRIAQLSEILERDPNHVPAREALLVALADAGEPDRGRSILEAWPAGTRDARFTRLRGRWDLDYDHQPDRAAKAYARSLADLPHDWKSHYGLARAYRALGRDLEARAEAEAVARLRERLNPASLGPRLSDDLARLDDPQALLDLSTLCKGVGLADLAESWRREALARPSARGTLPTDR
jgi:tetratricopeptide (TPR) repeat protein